MNHLRAWSAFDNKIGFQGESKVELYYTRIASAFV